MANIYDYQGNIIELDTSRMENFMNSAIEHATNLISGGLGGHVVIHRDNEGKPQQIFIMDTDNTSTARKVWRFSELGLAHSKDGYYGPYNNIALTPEGQINASLITTGILDADLLQKGTIIDATGESFWNLITGQIQISGNAKIGNTTFNNTINNLVNSANNYTDSKFDNYSSAINNIVNGLQNQIDGQIESWYYDYQPTLNNLPASEWYIEDNAQQTELLRQKHQGDIFYWQSTGYVYRFTKLNGEWRWRIIEDSQITQAIASAQQASQLANSKMRVFVDLPYPPYNQGDLWVQGANGDILKCIHPKTINQNYSFSDWAKASKYTDDSNFQSWIHGDFASILANINQGLVDGKISTYYQEEDPAYSWSSLAEMDAHQGDIWFDPRDTGGYYRWSGRKWEEIQAKPSDVFLEVIESKANIYTMSFPPYDAKQGDLWFQGPNYPILTYVNGEWVTYNNYTDNSQLINWLNNDYQEDLEAIQGQIDQKAETWYQEDDPAVYYQWTESEKLQHRGDLWYCTLPENKRTYRYTGIDWIELEVPKAVFDRIDGKAQIFINDPNDADLTKRYPEPPYNQGDLWVQGVNGDILVCIQPRAKGDQFDEDDWVYASKYGALIDAIGQQLDHKVNTYYGEDPMDDWDPSEYENHIGDLWCDPELNVISVFNGTGWDAQTSGDIPQEIFDKLDGVSQIFTQVPPATPTVPYYVDDIWIQGANGDMMKCIHKRTAEEQYNAADWVKATKYDKGQDAINVIIDSSAGNVFLRKDITTTLTCTVIKGNGTDITNRVTNFHWIKKNADGTVDTSWNRNLAGNTITLTEADVNSKAIFVCEVQFQEE